MSRTASPVPSSSSCLSPPPVDGHDILAITQPSITPGQLSAINSLPNDDTKMKALAEVVGVRQYGENRRVAIMIDFYWYNLMFCEVRAIVLLQKICIAYFSSPELTHSLHLTHLALNPTKNKSSLISEGK